MNPNTENIQNNNIVENIVNTVFNLGIDLGPPSQMVRHPSYDEYEEVGDVELIADGEFQGYDTPHDFVMPTPCSKCYQMCCNEDCSEEKEELAPLALTRVLTSAAYYYYKPGDKLEDEPEEEEDSIPPPLPLTRMFTNADLPEEKEADLVPLLSLPPTPLPLTRSFTNSHWPQDRPDEFYRALDITLGKEDKKDKVQEGEKQEDKDEDNYLDDYKEEYRYLYKR
jgi:hypothetical protein